MKIRIKTTKIDFKRLERDLKDEAIKRETARLKRERKQREYNESEKQVKHVWPNELPKKTTRQYMWETIEGEDNER